MLCKSLGYKAKNETSQHNTQDVKLCLSVILCEPNGLSVHHAWLLGPLGVDDPCFNAAADAANHDRPELRAACTRRHF